MSAVVFDIETLGFPVEHFDDAQRAYLLKGADEEEKVEAEIQKFSLSALTAQIIAIGMVNPETMAGQVLYQAGGDERFLSEDGAVEFIAGDEKAILKAFWTAVKRYDRFITFNGRGFDCPFIMLRSAIQGITPSRNLVPYRYDAKIHCDLLDQLTFYGAVRKYNLDFYCKAFGIKSPKSGGITGSDLGPMFREGRFREIARYCLGDIVATAELYRRWETYLHVRD
jgi:DNA polymerase elongation subunit (family B)